MLERLKIEFSLEEYIPLIEEVISTGGEFKLFPRGTSMLPLLRQGRDAVILVKPTACLKKRDIVLYRRTSGQLVLHRIVAVTKDGQYVLCGDNQIDKEKGITAEMIIAEVSAIYRDKKRIEKSDLRRSIYERLWCIMPVRKLCLSVKRVLCKIRPHIT